MTKDEHAFLIVKEELGELAISILELQKKLFKAARFGLHEQRDMPKSNLERIEDEWNDVISAFQNLERLGVTISPSMEQIKKKLAKIDDYTEYSKTLGIIKEE